MAAVAVLAGVVTATAAPPPVPALALPAGFTDTLVVGGFDTLTTVRGAPDGTIALLEQRGRVLMLPPGSTTPVTSLVLDPCLGSERGLLGVAFDPAFVTSGFVYLYYTRPSGGGTCVNRVSRFTMSSAKVVDPASEVVLLDNIPSTGGNHNGGDLNIGGDGHLYVAIGDAGRDPRGNSGAGGSNDAAQDLSLLVGKIVRVTTSGGVPPDNPFANDPAGVDCRVAGLSAPASGRCREIHSWGLRNPYRTPFDPNRNDVRFFINDVGQNTWEEVNEGGLGRNYGWNSREGACVRGSTTNCPPPPAGVTDPIVAYSHAATGCRYITGGAFVPDGWWAAEYDGGYLFADGGCGNVWFRSASGDVDLGQPFATVNGGLTDMAFVSWGEDPALFYVTQNGQLRRIAFFLTPELPGAPTTLQVVSPTRVYDSRTGVGGDGIGRLRGGTTRLIDIGAPSADVRAVLVNVTLTRSAGPTFIQPRMPRRQVTLTSVINASRRDELVANAVVLRVEGGKAMLHTSTTTHLVVDVLGHFSNAVGPVSAGRIETVDPARLVDSRQPSSPSNTYVRQAVGSGGRSQLTFPVAGRLGVPATGVSAAVLVITAVDRSPGGGFVTAHPAGATRPLASNLNTSASGDVRSNLVVVPLGAAGSVTAFLEGVDDIVVDVTGYVTGVSAPTTGRGRFVPTPPTRLFDTRSDGSVPEGGITGDWTTSGVVAPGASGLVHNITVTRPSRPLYVTATPSGVPLPLVSNVVVMAPGQTRAALAITRFSDAGQVRYHAQHRTHLVADQAGYLTGPG